MLVKDNLNTHGPASLYEASAPGEALRLKKRIEWHFTPKHGSWLNMAEIEIGVARRQCPERRMADQTVMGQEEPWLASWNSVM
ncbi:MAG: mobile element protein [Verrucomicrobiales bacterium]|nr:mobile element protein [Verrucomicrobiales bacterium]